MNATIRAPRSFPYLLLLPALVAMLLVVLFPLLYNIYLAFRNMSLYHFTDHTFVGLEQFRELFAQPVLYVLFVENLGLIRWDRQPEPADLDSRGADPVAPA